MTSFDKIEDLALITIDDYALNVLYNQDEDKFKSVCDGYLISAIGNFTRCRTSLSYNTDDRAFDSDLSDLEVSILADLWQIEWMERKTQDSKQFQLKLKNSSGFQFNSESQNLKEKSTHLDKMREKVEQKITQYQLQDLDSVTL